MAKTREWTPRPYSLSLSKEFDLCFDKFKRFWIFDKDSGLWIESADNLLEKVIREKLLRGPELSCHHVNEIIKDVKSLSYINDVPKDPGEELIPFANKIYDLKNKKSINYSKEYFFTSKLAVNYTPGATCPTIDRIFKQIVPSDRVIDLYEIIAYIFLRHYQNQLIFFLYGSGANGKGVYTKILERVLGIDNISSVSLTSLQYNKFSVAELYHKLANICSELRNEEMKNTDLIKKLSGGDTIPAERKFGHPFQFTNFAKLIFVTNALPPVNDKTYAFYRRLFLLEFPYTFEGPDQDRELLSKIAPLEYEGLAVKSLVTILSLKKRGFAFTNQPDPNKAAVEYERLSNPLDTFLKEICEEDESGQITKTDFKEAYTEWAKENGHRVLTDQEIKRIMTNKGIMDRKVSFLGSERKNAWIGIKWAEQ
jgi:putative DNA primase/helicase